MKFSFTILALAKNEEHYLPLLLTSAKDFLDDGGTFLVMDTGSTDQTRVVIKDYGATLVDYPYRNSGMFRLPPRICQKVEREIFSPLDKPWAIDLQVPVFNFSKARHYLQQRSPTAMNLFVDGDDIFRHFDFDRIDSYIQSGVSQFTYAYQNSDSEAATKVVLFNRDRFYHREHYKWVKAIHECLMPKCPHDQSRSTKELTHSELYLEHRRFDTSHHGSYLPGLLSDYFKEPTCPVTQFYLAREFYYLGRPYTAREILNKSCSKSIRWTAKVQFLQYFISRQITHPCEPLVGAIW